MRAFLYALPTESWTKSESPGLRSIATRPERFPAHRASRCASRPTRRKDLGLPCIMAGEPVAARHGVVLLADAEAVEVEVGPSKADLQDNVQVGQGAVGADEKTPPEHRVDVPDPGVEEVSFGLGRLFHGGVSLRAGQRLGSFLAPGLKSSPFTTPSGISFLQAAE